MDDVPRDEAWRFRGEGRTCPFAGDETADASTIELGWRFTPHGLAGLFCGVPMTALVVVGIGLSLVVPLRAPPVDEPDHWLGLFCAVPMAFVMVIPFALGILLASEQLERVEARPSPPRLIFHTRVALLFPRRREREAWWLGGASGFVARRRYGMVDFVLSAGREAFVLAEERGATRGALLVQVLDEWFERVGLRARSRPVYRGRIGKLFGVAILVALAWLAFAIVATLVGAAIRGG